MAGRRVMRRKKERDGTRLLFNFFFEGETQVSLPVLLVPIRSNSLPTCLRIPDENRIRPVGVRW